MVFLNFYLALSHEELARVMHEYSTAKIPTYAKAESFYMDAIAAATSSRHPQSLKVERETEKHEVTQSFDEDGIWEIPQDLSGRDSPVGSFFMKLHDENKYETDMQDPSRTGTPTSGFHHGSVMINEDTFDQSPPPRPKSRKGYTSQWDFSAETRKGGMVKTTSGTFLDVSCLMPRSMSSMDLTQTPPMPDISAWEDDPFAGPSPTTLTFSTPRPSPTFCSKDPSSPTPEMRGTMSSGSMLACHTDDLDDGGELFSPLPNYTSNHHIRYYTHLAAFEIQLHTHLNQVRALKLGTMTAQAERARQRTERALTGHSTLPQSRSFWSFRDSNTEDAEKTARVSEGRARGWVRQRFDPAKYAELEADALAEVKGAV